MKHHKKGKLFEIFITGISVSLMMLLINLMFHDNCIFNPNQINVAHEKSTEGRTE
jgi:hypothetical protein